MRTTLLVLSAALLLAGCAVKNTVLVSTGTVIGFEVGQNPSTGMYHAKLGYNRGEIALVPTTNGYTPDVVTELRYSGILSRADNAIYQRLAVGPAAVGQPGAMALFLKDSEGNISSNVVDAINSLSSIPKVDPAIQSGLAALARLYKSAGDKSAWDAIALEHNYPDFVGFIVDSKMTPEKLAAVAASLKESNLIQ